MRGNKIVLGILAHVDAGKTTLSEDILYFTGSIRKLGRVDHGDAFFDSNELERARGITIFSKQAQFTLGDMDVVLLDTPGHVDFSAEMERTLQVLDYGILVINGADGVQSHTMTLWRLLRAYDVPVFLFVNKMDQLGTDRGEILRDLQGRLDDGCIDFGCSDRGLFFEDLAMCDECLMEEFLESAVIKQDHISRAICSRKVFPCFFGSALKNMGVAELLEGLSRYCVCPAYGQEFGAKIYKITRDTLGNRLTHMKITGGCLKVKDSLSNRRGDEELKGILVWEEKVDQIRIYSGGQFKAVNEVTAGMVCVVTGLSRTFSGEGLGIEACSQLPLLEPVLTYEIRIPDSVDAHSMLLKLRLLEEEEPQLHVVCNEQGNRIHVQIMGDIEIEILKCLIKDRFDVDVEFVSGSVVYKETILEAVEGVGHFEPLRHYAEVHLLMEPGERGSGLRFDSRCSEDVLGRNWQRLVLSHLEEKNHRGVLTGAEITDMKITLVVGKAHLKHTEGGDFRQATYRAVRQGLKRARCVLLEPVYDFRLEIPREMVGRAMSDVQKMNGSFESPETRGDMSILRGCVPVAAMGDYQTEVTAYTKGYGMLICSLKGYEPCHNGDEVIAGIAYDSEKDTMNPTGSVFCAHGAGFTVGWQEVDQYMHLDSGLGFYRLRRSDDLEAVVSNTSIGGGSFYVDEKELEDIFIKTYGVSKREKNFLSKRMILGKNSETSGYDRRTNQKTLDRRKLEKYLLVDGYNIIFAWDELKDLAQVNLDSARDKLIDVLCNYQAYKQITLIVVFDAYRVKGGQGSVLKYNGVDVIYTKEAETADQYIERVAHKIGQTYDVTVATSDNLVQMIIWGSGAMRLSAQGLKEEIEAANVEIRETYSKMNQGEKNYPFEELGDVLVDEPN